MRITAFIFSLFYLISSVGYGIEVHYCLGRVSDVNHYLFETHCACEDVEVAPFRKCCEERSVFNQLEDEHHATSELKVEHVELPLIAVLPLELLQEKSENSRSQEIFIDRGPPRLRDIPIELVRLITYG